MILHQEVTSNTQVHVPYRAVPSKQKGWDEQGKLQVLGYKKCVQNFGWEILQEETM
jgi:hypothetical protein